MRSKFLIVTYADISPRSEEEFRIWQTDVQLPALRACPGVVGASWLECIDGQPRFLLLCGFEDDANLGSRAVRSALDWHPWTSELRGWHRRRYRLVHASGSSDDKEPYLLTVRSDVEPIARESFNEWYNETHLPDVVDCPGFVSAARYECTDGEPQYLALYDLSRPDALTTPEMGRVYGFGPMAPHVRNDHGRIYTRQPEMALT